MAATILANANDALAAALVTTRRAWSKKDIVRSEPLGALKGGSKRPDILVTEPNVSPVVIENEVLPATDVEAEAISRLGQQLRVSGRTILSSIAIRAPDRFRDASPASLGSTVLAAVDIARWRCLREQVPLMPYAGPIAGG
jgi:hypothetical protein